MSTSNPLELNTTYTQVKQSIIGLKEISKDDDDIHYIANRLNSVLQTVYDQYPAWNLESINEFVLSKHDPLRHISKKSDQLNNLVRKIQHDIVTQFA